MEEEVILTGKDLINGNVIGSLKRSVIKKQQHVAKPNQNNITVNNEEYDFRFKYRGLAIIICIDSFEPWLRMVSRPYAKEELKKTYETFTALGFLVIRFKDLTAQQIFEVLQAVSSPAMDFFNKEADCFACVLASHGNEVLDAKTKSKEIQYRQHVVFGTDAVIKTKELVDLFQSSSCKSLQNKPKLFFIQACRSIFGTQDPARFDQGAEVLVKHSKDCDRKEAGGDNQDRVEACNNVHYEPIPTTQIQDICTSDTKVVNKANSCDNLVPNVENTQDNPETSVIASSASDLDNENVPCIDTIRSGIVENVDVNDISEGPLRSLRKYFAKLFHRPNASQDEPLFVTSIPCHDDTLIMYSTASGKASFGRVKAGGWLIYALHEVVQHYLKVKVVEMDLLKILTHTMGVIATQLEVTPKNPADKSWKAAATIEHRLIKDVVFRKKYN